MGVADFYIDSPPLDRILSRVSLAISMETFRPLSLSQKEPIPTVFRGIGSQNFQIYRPIYGGGSRAALIASGKFGPRDVASRFLLSIFEPAPAAAAACRGVIDLKYGL